MTRVDRCARLTIAGMTLVAVGMTLTGAAAPAAAATSVPLPVVVRHDVVYRTIDGENLMLDVYLPTSKSRNRPAVVLVHGGGWAIGDKATADEREKANRLAALGFVVFAVDYRLAPQHPYPAAVDDVTAAVRWIRAAKQVRKYRFDPRRLGALGASAGGHLVAMLATLGRGSRDVGSRVRVAVSWSGPMDFTASGDGDDAVRFAGTVAGFLGCSAAAVECVATAAAASPVTHVDRTDAPMLLASSADDLVPVHQAERMDAALASVGVDHRLVVFPGNRHANDFEDDVWADTVSFLERHLGTPSSREAKTRYDTAR